MTLQTTENPPPNKEGWNHSDKVLVLFEAKSNTSHREWAIAYYHYKPPFEDVPKWCGIEGKNYGRTPVAWCELPSI